MASSVPSLASADVTSRVPSCALRAFSTISVAAASLAVSLLQTFITTGASLGGPATTSTMRTFAPSEAPGLQVKPRSIHQFDQCHRRIIALTKTEFENAQVAAVACRVTRTEFVEQLANHFAVTQTGKCETAICQARILAQRQDGFRNTAQFLGFGQRGFDDFVTQQRYGHVAKHRQTVAAGTVELS